MFLPKLKTSDRVLSGMLSEIGLRVWFGIRGFGGEGEGGGGNQEPAKLQER